MQDKELDLIYFLSFCIEQYKHKYQLTGENVVSLLEHYGVLIYLEDNYEVIHTQGYQWIMDEIDEFIRDKKIKEMES